MKPGLLKSPAPPSPDSGHADVGPADDGPVDVASAPDAGIPMVHGFYQDLEDHPKEQGFKTILVTPPSTAISAPDPASLPSTLGQFHTSSLPLSASHTSGSPSHISQGGPRSAEAALSSGFIGFLWFVSFPSLLVRLGSAVVFAGKSLAAMAS
ncbi:hypothetical protein MRB53_021822 [Persea americana]|uniref:Uncharacterized protein n=1 Tax=Persea americana TaxID=3435 RepID=A0ACC2L520_PERAE|nr:hypothetical protein MRB53_021822 [Persea americana]